MTIGDAVHRAGNAVAGLGAGLIMSGIGVPNGGGDLPPLYTDLAQPPHVASELLVNEQLVSGPDEATQFDAAQDHIEAQLEAEAMDSTFMLPEVGDQPPDFSAEPLFDAPVDQPPDFGPVDAGPPPGF